MGGSSYFEVVLPNAPSLIYPGKNQERLLAKRNRLLKKLYEDKVIDKATYELSLQESLPQNRLMYPKLLLIWFKK